MQQDSAQTTSTADIIRRLEREAEALKKVKEEARRQLHNLQVDEAAILERLAVLQKKDRRGRGTRKAKTPDVETLGSDDDDDAVDIDADMGQYAADIELEMEADEVQEPEEQQPHPSASVGRSPADLQQGQGHGHALEGGAGGAEVDETRRENSGLCGGDSEDSMAV